MAEAGKSGWSEAMLRALLDRRAVGAILSGLIGLHLVLVSLGLPGYQCPLHAATGLACPGCGISRAMLSLLHGQWAEMARCHVFAPYFLLLGVLLAAAAALGAGRRGALVECVVRIERRTHVHDVVLTAFALFGVIRVVKGVALLLGWQADG